MPFLKSVLASVASLLLVLDASSAAGAQIHVLTGAGMAAPVRQIAADFQQKTGTKVDLAVDVVSRVGSRLEAGEKYDLVIATTDVLDALAQKKLLAGSYRRLGRMVLGVASRTGEPRPDLGDSATVRKTLMDARSLAYVDPALGAVSSTFLLEQAAKMGIAEQVKAKARLQHSGPGVPAAVADGQAELGITLVSEMQDIKGVEVQPLPADLQLKLVYAAAVTANADERNQATAFLHALSDAEGSTVIQRSGLAPPDSP